MGMPSYRTYILSLLASTCLSSHGLAVEPSGSVVRVERITDASGPGGTRVLRTEAPIYSGDEITTNPNGLAQIRFLDDTKIVVGPNSRMVIDSFVYSGGNTARQVAVDAVKGVFRFISGNSPNSAYSIRTPTMVIGVRGTTIDIHSGVGSRVVFTEGSGDGTLNSGGHVQFQGGCRLYFAPPGGGVTTPQGLDQQIQMSAYFPLLQNQNQNMLDDAFKANTNTCTVVDSRLFEGPPESDSSRKAGTTGLPY
ncbi:MAG: FecR family protein [Propylenella sp.]